MNLKQEDKYNSILFKWRCGSLQTMFKQYLIIKIPQKIAGSQAKKFQYKINKLFYIYFSLHIILKKVDFTSIYLDKCLYMNDNHLIFFKIGYGDVLIFFFMYS